MSTKTAIFCLPYFVLAENIDIYEFKMETETAPVSTVQKNFFGGFGRFSVSFFIFIINKKETENRPLSPFICKSPFLSLYNDNL